MFAPAFAQSAFALATAQNRIHTLMKLTESQVEEIKTLLAEGANISQIQKHIAEKFINHNYGVPHCASLPSSCTLIVFL